MKLKLNRLLVVVDYQNDFVVGSLGFKKAEEIETNIVKKIKDYNDNNCEIVFTFDTHFDESFEKNNSSRNGWYLYGKVKEWYTSKTVTFSKYTFAPIEMSDYLRDKQYDSIEIVGVVTNLCVLANAILAQVSLPEAEIIVDSLCVASNDEALHNKALDIMQEFKFKVINRESEKP